MANGAFTRGESGLGCLFAGTNTGNKQYFDASLSSSAYCRTDNCVIPRYLNINYCIKY